MQSRARFALALLVLAWSLPAPGRAQALGPDPGAFPAPTPGPLFPPTSEGPPRPRRDRGRPATFFVAANGLPGYKVALTPGTPLSSPAVAGGKVYVGGGFHSREFFALEAATLAPAWSLELNDPGASAPVVAEGAVAFNTESCTLYVHDAGTGEPRWQKWLGDPLMSRPAIGGGKVFAAYPGPDTHHLAAFDLGSGKRLWDKPISAEVISAPVLVRGAVLAATLDGSLYALAAGTGRRVWSSTAHATSAPRVVGDRVWISQRVEPEAAGAKLPLEGLNALDLRSGKFVAGEPPGLRRAPWLLSAAAAGELAAVLHRRADRPRREQERRILGAVRQALDAAGGSDDAARELGTRLAEALATSDPRQDASADLEPDELAELAAALDAYRSGRPARGAPRSDALGTALEEATASLRFLLAEPEPAPEGDPRLLAALDAVAAGDDPPPPGGFGDPGRMPPDARLELASGNVGVASVRGAWAFQGSRPCPVGDTLVWAAGDTVRAEAMEGRAVRWSTRIPALPRSSVRLSSPALAGGKLYYGTSDGRIVCLDAADGRIRFDAALGEPIVAEPAVAGGAVFAATQQGSLVRLETGDPAADGWLMWGGSPGHDGAK